MQYHYVVGYNTETNTWFLESDSTAYFPDGNVYDPERSEDSEWGWFGWLVPEEGSPEEALDYDLLRTLQYIVDTWPTPQMENANGEL